MVYLAGKISGVPDYFEKFAAAANKLRLEGHSIYNPAAANLESLPLPQIMAHNLAQLCEVEAIALMPCWRGSDGAKIEWSLAKYLGKTIIYL